MKKDTPKHLRHLPEELVTHEVEDETKIHPLDPPHIVNQLTDNWLDKVGGKSDPRKPPAKTPLGLPKPGERARLTQWQIDLLRAVVARILLANAEDDLANGRPKDFRVRHLWFPEDNLNNRQLRLGNPPHNSDRPRHLKGFDLVVDPLYPVPHSVAKFVAEEWEKDTTEAAEGAEAQENQILTPLSELGK